MKTRKPHKPISEMTPEEVKEFTKGMTAEEMLAALPEPTMEDYMKDLDDPDPLIRLSAQLHLRSTTMLSPSEIESLRQDSKRSKILIREELMRLDKEKAKKKSDSNGS